MSPLKALAEGYTVIFPNNRSKDLWLSHYFKQSSEFLVISGYQALTMRELMEIFCDQGSSYCSAHLLNDNELFIFHSVWLKECFKNHDESLDLAQTISAINIISNWLIPVSVLENYALLPKEILFKDYYLHYLKKDPNLKTLFEIVAILTEAPGIKMPFSKMYFWGVDDLTPLQVKFIEYLKQDHVILHEDFQFDSSIEVQKSVYLESLDELRGSFSWLEQQRDGDISAIVVPSLGTHFSDIHFHAQNFFQDNCDNLPLESTSDNFVISHGFSAIEYPLVAQTLDFLQGVDSSCTYISSDIKIDLPCYREEKSLLQWVQGIYENLDKAQWCHTFDLSSTEYQAREFFLKTLESLGSISHAIGGIKYNFFIKILRDLFTHLIFQPESPRKKNKLILGLLEAAALPLDNVMLIHASEQQLFSQVQSHSYLNKGIARKYHTPHSSWEREVQYLSIMIQRLLSGKFSTISYSYLGATQGKIQNACLLIDKITSQIKYKVVESLADHVEDLHYTKICDKAIWSSSRWTLSEANAYYKCPFLGFAKKNHIPGIEVCHPDPLSPKDQGIFFHEYIQVKIDNGNTDKVISKYLAELPLDLQRSEVSKAEKVYQDCLQKIDLSSFTTEYSWSLESGGLTFVGRYDLFDQNSKEIFDFKSKNFNFSSWFSDTPTDIQGAVYTLSANSYELGVIKRSPTGAIIRTENTEQYYEHWQVLFKNLMEDIKSAKCSPLPRQLAECRNCPYKQGCRYEFN